jgi:hypothetical protein
MEKLAGEQRKEIESLKHDLAETESGRQIVELHEKLASLEHESARMKGEFEKRDAEAKRLAQSETSLQAELKKAREARDEAELRAEAGSESKLIGDNQVLRGIIDRQNEELARRLSVLNRLKAAQLGVRLFYAIFAVGFLGLIAWILQHWPELIPAGLK